MATKSNTKEVKAVPTACLKQTPLVQNCPPAAPPAGGNDNNSITREKEALHQLETAFCIQASTCIYYFKYQKEITGVTKTVPLAEFGVLVCSRVQEKKYLASVQSFVNTGPANILEVPVGKLLFLLIMSSRLSI